MKLSDVLSGTMEEFVVASGNYTWNYPNGDEMTGGIACGAHPLVEAEDKERLALPRYNGQDTVGYIWDTRMPARWPALYTWTR